MVAGAADSIVNQPLTAAYCALSRRGSRVRVPSAPPTISTSFFAIEGAQTLEKVAQGVSTTSASAVRIPAQ